jgi:hypothetical protein
MRATTSGAAIEKATISQNTHNTHLTSGSSGSSLRTLPLTLVRA